MNQRLLKNLVWLYFVLLIFEGTLRKWILPGYSNPLLIIRDPVVLMIYFLALSSNRFPVNQHVLFCIALSFISFVLSLFAEKGNLLVILYGIKANFLHLPFIFLIPQIFNLQDVIKTGKWVLYLFIPMAALMVIQFNAGPDDFWNYGPGATPGSQLPGEMGKIRPPGYFSFITGAAQYLALATSFIIYGLFKKGIYPTVLLYGSGVALVISTAVSSSRLALGSIGLVMVMIGVVYYFNHNLVSRRIFSLIVSAGLIMLVATNMDIYEEGSIVFQARLVRTGDAQVGMVGKATNWTERVFSDFTSGYKAMAVAPLFGYGLGVGTNVGAKLLTDELGFLLAEGEWARVFLEIGPVIGLFYIILRISICVYLFKIAALSARSGNFLPMLLFGSCFLLIISGQFGQATTLGFTVFIAGLTLAASREIKNKTKSSPKHVDVSSPSLA